MIVLVISCKKNQDLWPNIFKRGVANLYIACGGFEKTRLNGNILELNCNDLYDGLPEKVILAYEFIFKNIPFTHILKVDDHDTEFTSEQIQSIQVKFKDILEKQNYIGQNLVKQQGERRHHFGKVLSNSFWYNRPYNGIFRPWLGGGETYILSKNAVHCILKKYNQSTLNILRTNEIFEDVMVAKILFEYDIHPYKLDYGIKTWIA
jgi:hypothetical protein